MDGHLLSSPAAAASWGPGDQTCVFRLGGKPLDPLSHPTAWGFFVSFSACPLGSFAFSPSLTLGKNCWELLNFCFLERLMRPSFLKVTCIPGWPWTCYTAKDDLKLLILLLGSGFEGSHPHVWGSNPRFYSCPSNPSLSGAWCIHFKSQHLGSSSQWVPIGSRPTWSK